MLFSAIAFDVPNVYSSSCSLSASFSRLHRPSLQWWPTIRTPRATSRECNLFTFALPYSSLHKSNNTLTSIFIIYFVNPPQINTASPSAPRAFIGSLKLMTRSAAEMFAEFDATVIQPLTQLQFNQPNSLLLLRLSETNGEVLYLYNCCLCLPRQSSSN